MSARLQGPPDSMREGEEGHRRRTQRAVKVERMDITVIGCDERVLDATCSRLLL